ncbi:MAG: hypothetical protein J5590_02575 [Clostridia bacterium]|nr:hypothetical protein [Clostridia bacterium]
MKFKKSFLSIILAISMVFLLLPFTASAGSLQVYTDIYDQIVYSGGTYDISVKVVGGTGLLQYRWQLCGYQKSGKDYWFYIAGKDWP